MAIIQVWRLLLAIWLIVGGIIRIAGPAFPSAHAIEGLLAIVTAVFLLLSLSGRKS